VDGASASFRNQDLQEITNFWLTHTLCTAQQQARDEVQGVCMASLQQWETQDFEKAATWMEWIAESHSQSFPSYESMEELPMTILLGAYAPSSILKSACRITRAFPQADMAYIQGGGINFELEGEDQVKNVAEHLLKMMKSVLATASRPQRHWRDLRAAAHASRAFGGSAAFGANGLDPESAAAPFPAALNAFGRKRQTVGRIQDNDSRRGRDGLVRMNSTRDNGQPVSPKPKSAQFQEISSPCLPLGTSVTLLDAQSMLEARSSVVHNPIPEVSEHIDEPAEKSDGSAQVSGGLRSPSLRGQQASRGQQQARQAANRNSPTQKPV